MIKSLSVRRSSACRDLDAVDLGSRHGAIYSGRRLFIAFRIDFSAVFGEISELWRAPQRGVTADGEQVSVRGLYSSGGREL